MDNSYSIKKGLKQLFNLVNLTINRLNEEQLLNLLEGRAKIIYQEIKPVSERNTKCNQQKLEEIATKFLSLNSRSAADDLLRTEYKVKKAELQELGKYLDVYINSRDKKEEIIDKLIEAVVGAKLRSKIINETNLRKKLER